MNKRKFIGYGILAFLVVAIFAMMAYVTGAYAALVGLVIITVFFILIVVALKLLD